MLTAGCSACFCSDSQTDYQFFEGRNGVFFYTQPSARPTASAQWAESGLRGWRGATERAAEGLRGGQGPSHSHPKHATWVISWEQWRCASGLCYCKWLSLEPVPGLFLLMVTHPGVPCPQQPLSPHSALRSPSSSPPPGVFQGCLFSVWDWKGCPCPLLREARLHSSLS